MVESRRSCRLKREYRFPDLFGLRAVEENVVHCPRECIQSTVLQVAVFIIGPFLLVCAHTHTRDISKAQFTSLRHIITF